MVSKTVKLAIRAGVPLAILAIMVVLMFSTWDFIQGAQERERLARERVGAAAYDLVRACLDEPGPFCDDQMIKMGIDCNEGKLEVCQEAEFRQLLVSYYEMRNFPRSGDAKGPAEPCIEMEPGVCIPESMTGGDT